MTQQNSNAAVDERPIETNSTQQPEAPETPAATSQGDGDGGGRSEINHGDGEDDSA